MKRWYVKSGGENIECWVGDRVIWQKEPERLDYYKIYYYADEPHNHIMQISEFTFRLDRKWHHSMYAWSPDGRCSHSLMVEEYDDMGIQMVLKDVERQAFKIPHLPSQDSHEQFIAGMEAEIIRRENE